MMDTNVIPEALGEATPPTRARLKLRSHWDVTLTLPVTRRGAGIILEIKGGSLRVVVRSVIFSVRFWALGWLPWPLTKIPVTGRRKGVASTHDPE